MTDVRIWEIRNPDGAAMGLEVAKAQMAPADVVLAHAMPERVDVWVRDGGGNLVVRDTNLSHDAVTPITRFTIAGDRIERENIWPGERDLDLPLILPGGEVGILKAWWNADDHKAWRWTLELENSVG